MNLYIRLPRLLGLSVPLRGPLFFLLSVPSSLPSFLFRPSYCSVEGEFLFSSSLPPSLVRPFPAGEKEALRIPLRRLPLIQLAPRLREGERTPPRLVPTRERLSLAASPPPQLRRGESVGGLGGGRSLRRDRRSRSSTESAVPESPACAARRSAAAALTHSQCFLARHRWIRWHVVWHSVGTWVRLVKNIFVGPISKQVN